MTKKIFWYLAACTALIASGCKKDDSSTSLPSLSGLSISSAPTYVSVGDNLTFHPSASNVAASVDKDPGTLGMYWQVNSAKRDTLTKDIKQSMPDFTYRVDSLGSYVVYCYVYAENGSYYSASASASFKAIDPATAITGIAKVNPVTLDGNTYPSTTAGGKIWLGANLYGTSAGVPYLDCAVMDSVYGRYYTWEEAQTACPSGWHLPSAEEFDQCLGTDAGALMVNANFEDDNLWEYWSNVTITNSLSFNAIPAGYTDLNNKGTFSGHKEYACWWTSTKDEDLGCFRYIYEKQEEIQKGKGDIKTLALNVRCVKD